MKPACNISGDVTLREVWMLQYFHIIEQNNEQKVTSSACTRKDVATQTELHENMQPGFRLQTST